MKRILLAIAISLFMVGCSTTNSDIADMYLKDKRHQENVQQILDLWTLYLDKDPKNKKEVIKDVDTQFHADGVRINTLAGEVVEEYRGREALIKKYNDGRKMERRDPTFFFNNFSMIDPRITFDGENKATLNVKLLNMYSYLDNQIDMVSGRYVAELEKDADGQWKFKVVTAHMGKIIHWEQTGKAPVGY